MKEIVLITGAGGLIAKPLAEKLKTQYQIRFLSRNPNAENVYRWNPDLNMIDPQAIKGISHIIHLSGANIIAKRWSNKRKIELENSRIGAAKLLLQTLIKENQKIQTFISASAVGYYDTSDQQHVHIENEAPGKGYMATLVKHWEHAAFDFEKEQIAQRVLCYRLGVVLSNQGGALVPMKKSVQFFMGAALGSGKQYMPWIHIQDAVQLFTYGLNTPHLKGIYNAVSPQSVSNKQFTQLLGQILKRPLWLPNVPSFLLKKILGEASQAVLEGTAVSCQKICAAGYTFQFPDLKSALQNLLKK